MHHQVSGQLAKFKTPFELLKHLMDINEEFIEDPTVYKSLLWPVVNIISNSRDFVFLADEVNSYRYSDEQVYTMLFYSLPKRQRFIKGPVKNDRNKIIAQLSKLMGGGNLEQLHERCYNLTNAQLNKEIRRLSKGK